MASSALGSLSRALGGDGDLDLELRSSGGSTLDSSTSTSDTEEVTGSADTVLIRVYGYSGATGDYDLLVTLD